MTGPRLLRNLLLATLFGAAVAAGLALAVDLPATLAALAEFRWRLIPLVVLAVLVNYALRFWKWGLYLDALAIRLPRRDSLLVFLSGFTMAITPGKLGELLKAFLVRQLTGTEVSRTASVVMAERLTDVAGVLLLAALGASAFPYGGTFLAGTTLLVLASIVVLQARPVAYALLARVEHLPLLGRLAGPFRLFFDSSQILLALRILLPTILLSAASWFSECLAFYLIFLGLGLEHSLLTATFVYAFASLAGALSMLPGGLGVAEGSLTGLLVALGTPGPQAVAATLLVRVATLWLAVGLGTATLLGAYRRFLA